MGQKKCPHCGNWSEWNQHIDDTCDHCGKNLSPVEVKRDKVRKDEKKKNEEEWMFYIKESDTSLVKFFKKVGNGFYTVFMAIMTFILWLIAALPG
jgi:methionyl-tRNA synthetase